MTNWIRRHRAVSIALVILCAAFASAFFYYQATTQLSYATQVFNQVTAPIVSPVPSAANPGGSVCAAGTACPIQDSGAGAHWVKYCIVAGTVTNIAIHLEGSDDQVNWMQISEEDNTLTGTSGCNVLEAGGYYRWLRVNLVTFAGTSPKPSAWYSGIGTAIAGGGIIAGNKSSQPVSFKPASVFINTNLKSSPVLLSLTSSTAIQEISVYNPNGSPVFLLVTHAVMGPTQDGTAVFGVAANAPSNIPFPNGIAVNSNGQIACATSAGGSGDPTTGCVVTIAFKQGVTVSGGGQSHFN